MSSHVLKLIYWDILREKEKEKDIGGRSPFSTSTTQVIKSVLSHQNYMLFDGGQTRTRTSRMRVTSMTIEIEEERERKHLECGYIYGLILFRLIVQIESFTSICVCVCIQTERWRARPRRRPGRRRRRRLSLSIRLVQCRTAAGRGLPLRPASRLSTARCIIASRVVREALPMCGNRTKNWQFCNQC